MTAVYLPHTDHMFDLAGTMWSPAGRVAFHTFERFLAVIGPHRQARRHIACK